MRDDTHGRGAMTEQIEATVTTARHALRPAVTVEPTTDHAALRAERERIRRARAAYEAKLSRLRLYSYCLTLGSCVLALMAFMYVTQGTADGDATFTWLGVAFGGATVCTLWSAIRVSQVGEFAA
jgi:hypothetical protein